MAVSGENSLLRVAADFFNHADRYILFDQIADISMPERMAVAGFYPDLPAGLLDSGQTIRVRVGKDPVLITSSILNMSVVFSVIDRLKPGGERDCPVFQIFRFFDISVS